VQIPFAPGTIGDLKDGLHNNLDYHLLACAGAQTHHVLGTEITFPGQPVQPNPLGELPKGPQNGRELTEIDRGFLDENTTLVMLNIGGNDAGWTDALQTCILGQLACHTDDEFRDDLIDHITGPVPDAIAQVMTQIAAAAPNAMILLVGYPTLFSEGVVCASAELTLAERTFLNDMGEVFSFNTVFDRTVADPTNSWRSFGVEVFDDDFSPVCNLYVSYPGQGINGVRFENPPLYWQGAGDGSFHPTGTGYDRYASAVEDELNVRGYLW
jgi:lysophospholipase L1-like esterase